MRPSFTTTKKKIAFTFAVAMTAVIATTTFFLLLLIKSQFRIQARDQLAFSLSSLSADFQANQIQEKQIAFQSDKTKSAEYLETSRLRNITSLGRSAALDQSEPELSEEKTQPQAVLLDSQEGESALNIGQSNQENQIDQIEKDKPSAGNPQVIITDEQAFEELRQYKEVYSRVILPNGDILFSSDLFDTVSVDPDVYGFHELNIRGICIYAQTEIISSGDRAGSVIQVAQYCPLTPEQQRELFYTMVGLGFVASLAAYILGLALAGRFLRPLQDSATQTKVFAQHVYHELFTPVTVAITTVASALRSKRYKQGLESLDEDLTHIQESLQLLGDRAFKSQADFNKEEVDVSTILSKVLEECIASKKQKSVTIDTRFLEPKIIKQGNQTSIRLILQNIIGNACKYAQPETTITVTLSDTMFVVKNTVLFPEKIEIDKFFTRYYQGNNGSAQQSGKGLGLALVKELSEIQGWSVSASLDDDQVIVSVQF